MFSVWGGEEGGEGVRGVGMGRDSEVVWGGGGWLAGRLGRWFRGESFLCRISFVEFLMSSFLCRDSHGDHIVWA